MDTITIGDRQPLLGRLGRHSQNRAPGELVTINFQPSLPQRAAFLLACVLLYMWPALLNGGPFFFPDSSNYIRAADAAMVTLTGHSSQWSDRLTKVSTAQPAGIEPSGTTEVKPTRPVLNGRSVYYGALLYIGIESLGRYGPIFIQAAIQVLALMCILIAVPVVDESKRWRWCAIAMLAIGLLSPLPFFVSRLMPDAFTGIFVASVISLLAFWHNHSSLGRVFLILLCAVAVTFHTTHVLLALAISGGAVALNLRRWQSWTPRICLPILLVAVAGLAQLAFSNAVERSLGSAPITPPFLSARIIADGPGYKYLSARCPNVDFALCDYLDRMPQGSDTFLWSNDPENGVFSVVPADAQRNIANEDKAFYLAVLKDQPASVAGSLVRSVGEQFTTFTLDHFNYIESFRQNARQQLPRDAYSWVAQSAAFSNKVPTAPTEAMSLLTAIIGTIILAVVSVNAMNNLRKLTPVHEACVLLFIAIIANIVMCGALSTPHGRYLMRIIWLFPLGVTMLAMSRKAPANMNPEHPRELRA
jgi:hypothetical protein